MRKTYNVQPAKTKSPKQKDAAKVVAAKGRFGDTELVHMSKDEVASLKGIAAATGNRLTTNPDTGAVEAFSLRKVLSFIAPIAATVVGGPAAGAAVSAAVTKYNGGSWRDAALSGAGSFVLGKAMGAGQSGVDAAVKDGALKVGADEATSTGIQSALKAGAADGAGAMAQATGTAAQGGINTAVADGSLDAALSAAPTDAAISSAGANPTWGTLGAADKWAVMKDRFSPTTAKFGLDLSMAGQAGVDAHDAELEHKAKQAKQRRKIDAEASRISDIVNDPYAASYAEGGIVTVKGEDPGAAEQYVAPTSAAIEGYTSPQGITTWGTAGQEQATADLNAWSAEQARQASLADAMAHRGLAAKAEAENQGRLAMEAQPQLASNTDLQASNGIISMPGIETVTQDPQGTAKEAQEQYNLMSHKDMGGQSATGGIPNILTSTRAPQATPSGISTVGSPLSYPTTGAPTQPRAHIQYKPVQDWANFKPSTQEGLKNASLDLQMNWDPRVAFPKMFSASSAPKATYITPVGTAGVDNPDAYGGEPVGGNLLVTGPQNPAQPAATTTTAKPPTFTFKPAGSAGYNNTVDMVPLPDTVEGRRAFYKLVGWKGSEAAGVAKDAWEQYKKDWEQYRINTIANGGEVPGYAAGGHVKGSGDGMSDGIAAVIDGKRPAAIASGEYILPADVVSHLGNGDTNAGVDYLDHQMALIRKASTGTAQQRKRIDPTQFIR